MGCHHLHAMVFSVLPLVTALQVGDKYSEQLKIQKQVYYNISKGALHGGVVGVSDWLSKGWRFKPQLRQQAYHQPNP